MCGIPYVVIRFSLSLLVASHRSTHRLRQKKAIHPSRGDTELQYIVAVTMKESGKDSRGQERRTRRDEEDEEERRRREELERQQRRRQQQQQQQQEQQQQLVRRPEAEGEGGQGEEQEADHLLRALICPSAPSPPPEGDAMAAATAAAEVSASDLPDCCRERERRRAAIQAETDALRAALRATTQVRAGLGDGKGGR